MKKIGIDFGSLNTYIAVKGKGIIFSEPTVIALNKLDHEVVEIGYLASKMQGKSPDNIEVVNPIQRGVIARYEPCVKFLRSALLKSRIKSLKGYEVVFAVPSSITPVEQMVYCKLAKEFETENVTFENEAKLSAYASTIKFKDNEGTMIANIGADTTSVIVMSGENILVSRSALYSGNLLNEAILRYLRKNKQLLTGNKTAEFIKLKIGTIEETPENRLLEIAGRDIVTSLPHNVTLSTHEVKKVIEPITENLIDAISDAISLSPYEIVGDITANGLVISGGGALLNGLKEYLQKNTYLPVRIAPDSLSSVINGLVKLIEK